MDKRIGWLFVFLIMIGGINGCGLMPKEEEYPSVQVLAQADTVKYNTTKVTRNDIQIIEVVRFSYQAPEAEKYSFKFDNEKISQVYVEVGDTVQKGDVLAEVDITAQQEQVRVQQETVDDLYLQLKHVCETEELSISEAEIQDKNAEKNGIEGWKSQTDAIVSDYEDQKRLIQQSIVIAEKKLERAQDELQGRQVIAGMDGTVTFLYEYKEGEIVSKRKTVAIIKDMESARFEVDSQNEELLEDGKIYVAEIDNEECEVIATVTEKEGEESDVYLNLVTPDPDLETGVTGIIRMIVGESKDVLCIPINAVYETEEGYVVYCMDELGFRVKRLVKVGISDGEVIEIVSGLEENEVVIVD